MTSRFPKIIIGGDSLKENLDKIHDNLKNKSRGGLILQSSSKDNNLKLYCLFNHLLYDGNKWKEGRFKISKDDNGNSQLRVILSKRME